MGNINITKVAYGCGSIEILASRMAARVKADGEASIFTRFLPKRADELIGGSLYWIIKQHLTARQEITGFSEAVDADGRKRIRMALQPDLVPVVPLFFRPHQGWRYLDGVDAPSDLSEQRGADDLPPEMLAELARLGLV